MTCNTLYYVYMHVMVYKVTLVAWLCLSMGGSLKGVLKGLRSSC